MHQHKVWAPSPLLRITHQTSKVTESIARDLAAQEVELEELHIDRAYLSSELVRERSEHLDVYCNAWAVRNAGRYPKTAFALD